jgi:hypothetical protein
MTERKAPGELEDMDRSQIRVAMEKGSPRQSAGAH